MITSLGMQTSDVVSAMRTEVRAMAIADAHALANAGVIPTQDQLFAWAKTAAGRFHPNMAAAAAATYIDALNDQVVLPEAGLGAALAVDLASYFGRPVHTLTLDQFAFFVRLRKAGNRFLRKGKDRAPESGFRVRLPRPQRRENVVVEGRTFDVDVSIELPCGAVARVLAEDVDTGRIEENDEHTSFRVRRWEGLVEVCWFAGTFRGSWRAFAGVAELVECFSDDETLSEDTLNALFAMIPDRLGGDPAEVFGQELVEHC